MVNKTFKKMNQESKPIRKVFSNVIRVYSNIKNHKNSVGTLDNTPSCNKNLDAIHANVVVLQENES